MDNIFAKINKDINIKPFRRQYMNNLECLRNSILSKLKNDEVFSKFYNGVYLKGSYGDNLKLFQDLRTSLKERNLPFFWDKELNLYEKIGEAAILEMTKCVVCKTDALEKYKIIRKKSINDDFKIYEIFLTEEERIRMGIRKMAITPTNEATQFFTEREEVTTPDVSSWSKCIMS
ncbi:uncharacterized protein [Eurosta solidaginis]|uniref:uncharacterized protein isoform X4 n=1 Tax=Eurosta solidaginis TaxID=178769 RepID=UPI003530FD8B